jgi:limonene-1,2-epoxide hydrolase
VRPAGQYDPGMRRVAALAAALVVAAAGTGAGSAAAPARTPAQVVHAWSAALNANRNAAAADLFAPKAHVIQAGLVLVLRTHAVAVAFNAALPCAGKIVGLTVHRNRAVATFVLGERPNHTCDGPGQKAAALFVVEKGKIVLWEQVAVPPAGPTA